MDFLHGMREPVPLARPSKSPVGAQPKNLVTVVTTVTPKVDLAGLRGASSLDSRD